LILLWISSSWAAETESIGSALAQAVAFLFPIGLSLIAWSALPDDRSAEVAALATLGFSLAIIGYYVVGFGFHFGGAAFVSNDPGLRGLSRFFSLVRGSDSANWGIVGLEGFLLSGDAVTQSAIRLFLSQLPLLAASGLIVMIGLPRRMSLLAQLMTGMLISAITIPLASHWISGGGWLARLGNTLNLGHGLVDFNGAGTIFVTSGATILAAALVFGRHSRGSGDTVSNQATVMPPARFPLLAAVGALLAAVGWIALGLSNPLYAEAIDALSWPLIVVNGLMGLAGGSITAQLYSAFTTGRFDPLMGPRGALAGLVAASVGAPFMPTWAALIIGAVAGLLLPLTVYVIDRLLQLEDATAAIAGYCLPGAWGLLAVALFADGRWGQGWNGFNGPAEQGVSGLIVAPGLHVDTGQLGAQAWGAAALFALGFFVPWGLMKILAGLASWRPLRKDRTNQSQQATASILSPASERQSASSRFDRVVNMDDGS
jgi:Amt family ammonium transporter